MFYIIEQSLLPCGSWKAVVSLDEVAVHLTVPMYNLNCVDRQPLSGQNNAKQ